MTQYLLKKYGHDRKKLGELSGMVGIGCNLALFALKILVGQLTGALSVTADALNNLTDASGSIVTLVGFRLAGKPADREHPYGHARYEYLSGLAVSVLILFIGLSLGQSSVAKILNPSPVRFTAVSAGILLASIGVKLWMSLFNRKLGKHIRSDALLAVSADSRNDCIATAGALMAGGLETLWNIPADGFVGLAVAVFILLSGWNMAKETLSPLLGEGADPELRGKILRQLQSHPKVLGYHDLMVHDYGPGRQYASVHVEMDSREDPLECHGIIDEMEYLCMKDHGVHLVIHYDPVVTHDPELKALRLQAQEALGELEGNLTLHDFRMVPGRNHRNLLFDVPLPHEFRGREEQIRSHVEERMNRGESRFHVLITFDAAEQ